MTEKCQGAAGMRQGVPSTTEAGNSVQSVNALLSEIMALRYNSCLHYVQSQFSFTVRWK